MINDPNGVFSDYYFYLNVHRKRVEGHLTQPVDVAAERQEAMAIAKELIVLGTADQVLDQLVAFSDEVGRFGTLMVTGHDISRDPEMWRTSMQTLAQDVAPRLSQHMN